MPSPNYQDPTKQAVRETIWSRAVRGLCSKRATSAILNVNLIEELWTRATQDALPFNYKADPQVLDYFLGALSRETGFRRPEDLRVLYFAGPNPQNDLEVAMRNGIRIENVWAIEADSGLYHEGVGQLRSDYPHLKLAPMQAVDFLGCCGEKFDIIYLDFTDSLLSGQKSKTASTLHSVFDGQRLAPLGCLVTNFTDLEHRGACDDLLAGYLWAQPGIELGASDGEGVRRYFPQEEGIGLDDFKKLVASGREGAYGFMATQYPALYASYFSAIQRVFRNPRIRSILVEHKPGMFPKHPLRFTIGNFGWLAIFAEGMNKSELKVRHCRLKGELTQVTDNYTPLELAGLFNYLSDWWTPSAPVNADFSLAPKLLGAISSVHESSPEALRLYCDCFFRGNWVTYLVHQLGYPYFRNGRASSRITYRANTRRMMTDIAFYDQCRPAFDHLGLLEMFGDGAKRFDRQMLARSSIDAISKATRDFLPYLYTGANLYSYGEMSSVAWWSEYKEREVF